MGTRDLEIYQRLHDAIIRFGIELHSMLKHLAVQARDRVAEH
jgi:hypothetical protein